MARFEQLETGQTMIPCQIYLQIHNSFLKGVKGPCIDALPTPMDRHGPQIPISIWVAQYRHHNPTISEEDMKKHT